MEDPKGRTAVVTGAAGGIGLAMARRFAVEGMQLVLCDVNGDDLALHSNELQAGGVDVLAVRTDATDPAAMDSLADAALERFGHVDVLCPNAGIVGPPAGAAWEIPLEDWQRATRVGSDVVVVEVDVGAAERGRGRVEASVRRAEKSGKPAGTTSEEVPARPLLMRMVDAGFLHRKTGRSFYECA